MMTDVARPLLKYRSNHAGLFLISCLAFLLCAGGAQAAAGKGKSFIYETNNTFTNVVETNYVSNCVYSSTYTNASYPGSVSSSGPSVMPSPVCVGQPVTASVGSYYYSYAMHEVITTYSGSNCPSSTDYYYSSPWVVSESYSITGPASGSGSGGSVTFTPSTTGAGTVTFTVTYDDGTGNTESFQTATYYSVINCTNMTNCAYSGTSTNCTPGSMTFDNPDIYSATNCAGSSVSAYLGYSYYTPGFIEYVTTYTGGCPPETNGYSAYPYIVDVTYQVTGPHSETGSGSSVWFTTTNTGSGSITFTITYDDGCGGLETVTSSGSYSVSACTSNCTYLGTSTNCVPGSMTYSSATVTPATNCVGSGFSASAGYPSYTPGYQQVITSYSGTNCPSSTNTSMVYPSVVSVSYVLTGPYSGSGSGSSVSFTPTNSGSGSVTFTITYNDGCGGTQTTTSSGSYSVSSCSTNCIQTSRQTNCISSGYVTLIPSTNSLSGCQSNSMSASVTVSNIPGKIETVTYYSNCPPTRTTNTFSPTLGSNWWVVSGVAASPSSGSGLSASFTPTGSGMGSVTFYQQYSNTPPCSGSGPASVSVSINVAAAIRTTNCLVAPSVSLSPGTNNVLTNCLGSPISASMTAIMATGKVEIVNGFTSTNCPSSRVTNNVTSTIRSNWWVATGPGGFSASGSGLSASFTPTNSGMGTLTFYLQYSNPAPCSGSTTISSSLSYTIHGTTKTTNCLVAPSVSLVLGTNNVLTNCLGSAISASASSVFSTGKIEIVTASTSTNCPTSRITNNVTSTVRSNWWVVTGPGGFTTNGSGLSASFTPTNSGNGTITFYLQYTNPAPCSGSTTVSTSCPFTIIGVTKTTNCLTEASIQFTNISGSPLFVGLGSALSATAQWKHNTGRVEIVSTPASTNCPTTRVTNNYTSDIVTNWWVASGPGAFTTNGTGFTATFTPTNAGHGTVTFFLRYTNRSPCTGSNTISIATNYTVLKVEILNRGGTVISGTNAATNAVRYILKSKVTPDTPGLTYLWKVNGGVPAANVAIKIYRHILPNYTASSAGEHIPTNMAASHMTSTNLELFWTRPGTPQVVLEVSTNSVTVSTNVYVKVENDPDPNRYIYSKASPDVDHNPDGSGGFYDVCEDHGYWHHGATGTKYDSGMGGVNYRGAKFFNWHRAIMDLHQKWRTTFGITTTIDPSLGTTKPSYFTNVGGAEISDVYKYVRLEEYPTQEQLGDDIHPWHNAGHNNQATVSSAAGTGNTPDIDNSYTNLRGSNNLFWSWHGNIDALRSTIPLPASVATVSSTVPANGAGAVPNGGTTIDVVFNKPVSANGVQTAGDAAKSNEQCTLTNRVQLIAPGGGTTNVPTALSVSADNKTHTFTVPAMTTTGVWTFRLIGTARGYRGVTNTFTVAAP